MTDALDPEVAIEPVPASEREPREIVVALARLFVARLEAPG